MRSVAYLTDVEGRWDKVTDFCAENPFVSLDPSERLRVAEGAVFVFGGDAIDRGPRSRKIVRTLLEAKRAQPDRVVLLAGNRDINKMRLVRELSGHPPPRARAEHPGGSRADLLRFIFSRTMGAGQAFENRRTELADEGRAAGDDDVVESFLSDLAPGAPLADYLSELCLAHREGELMFVHGGVTRENLFAVPNAPRTASVDGWVRALNDFYSESVAAFTAERYLANGEPAWSDLVAYQAPLTGTRLNQTSVVYARPTNPEGDPILPPRDVTDALARDGVRHLAVGHTPCGDCPAVLRDGDFTMVLADNSYGRIESGSRVAWDGGVLRVSGVTELDSGERETIDFTLGPADPSPIGLRDEATSRLVKAPIEGGYLMFRSLDNYRVEQHRATAEDVARAKLVVPR